MSDWKSKLRFFPCHSVIDGSCTCGDPKCGGKSGKHPRSSGWQRQATNDPEQVAKWTSDPAINLGIACGPDSDLFVLDVDVKNNKAGLRSLADLQAAHGDLPPTAMVVTGSGGYQYYFQHPADSGIKNAVEFLPGLDVRTTGGLVIAHDSRHLSGRKYQLVTEHPPTLLPEWLKQEILAGQGQRKSRNQLIPAEGLKSGNRNNSIFKLAAKNHHAGAAFESTLQFCLAENRRAEPPLPESEVETAVRSAYGYETEAQLAIPDTTDQALALAFIESDPPLLYVADDRSWRGYADGLWLEKESPVHEIGEFLRSLEPANVPDPKLTIKLHQRLQSKAAAAGALFFIEANTRLHAQAGDFDPDSWLLGLPNGELLNLKTGERRSATRADLITRQMPVPPAGKCERWLRYLEETHPDDPEVISYLQRLVGYYLTSSTVEDMIAFFIGVGGSGKGTFAEPLQKLLGRYCVSIPIGMLLEDTAEDRRLNYIASLCGARLAICNEGSKMRRLDSRGIKMLTGGGWATGRRLGQQPIEFKQTHKILILANDNPVLELDDAMRQRVNVVPFNKKFRGEQAEEKGLREFFCEPEQLSGIFNWAVEGCQAWQTEGLKPPASVKTTTDNYFMDADLMEQFLRTHTEDGPQFFAATESLFERWKVFCERQGQGDRSTVGSARTFTATLLEKRPKLVPERRQRRGEPRQSGFMGIRLLGAAEGMF